MKKAIYLFKSNSPFVSKGVELEKKYSTERRIAVISAIKCKKIRV